MFTNVLEDQIFSSFLVSSEIVIDNNLLVKECLTKEQLEQICKGISLSTYRDNKISKIL
jgi:hypothetical protein